MNLNKYTKAELIEAIEMLTDGSRSELERCLYCIDVYCIDENRVKALCDEANRLNKVSTEARQQYIDMLKPYNGKKFRDIPIEVIAKSQRWIDRARETDDKCNKIMKKIERMRNY